MKSASRRGLRSLAVALLCAAALTPRSSSAQRDGARQSSDAILGWRLDAAWSVGGAADTSLIVATLKVKDIATYNGTLLIVDRDRSQVARYASNGERLAPIGRGEGAGPGELRFPRSVAVDPAGRIIVEDRVNGRISYFDASGRFLRHRPHEVQRSISELRAVTDSSLIGLVTTFDSVGLSILTDQGLRSIAAIQAPRLLGTGPVCGAVGYPFRTLFGPTLLFAASGSVLAFAAGDGDVSIYRGDRPVGRHAHAFPRRRTNRAMARAHLGEGVRIQVQGRPPCTVPTEMILDAGEFAPELPAYGSLAVDPEGIVWATRFAVGKEPAMADLFHPEKGYVGTVALGTVRPVAFLSSSLLVSLETDVDEVPIVRVYRVLK